MAPRYADAPWTPETPAPVDRLIGARMDQVECWEVRWIWQGNIARGRVILLAGHPGDGKTTLNATVTAILSNGGALPDGQPTDPPTRF
ncbi:MAG: AAA family ATPase [Thermomicrobiales bacterium]